LLLHACCHSEYEALRTCCSGFPNATLGSQIGYDCTKGFKAIATWTIATEDSYLGQLSPEHLPLAQLPPEHLPLAQLPPITTATGTTST